MRSTEKRYFWSILLLTLVLGSCFSPRGTSTVQPRATGSVPSEVLSLTQVSSAPAVATEIQPAATSKPQAEQKAEATWEERAVAALNAACQQDLLQTSQLGLYVYDLTAGTPFYAVNATHRMRPASCQKLVTAITALQFLGGDYLFHTSLCVTGAVSGGTLNGDVYVVGGMDPMLCREDLQKMVAALKQAGVVRVAGHVYADLSMKDDQPYGWGWSWDDDYGPLSALMVGCKDQFASDWATCLSRAGIRLSHAGMKPKTCPATGVRQLLTITHTIDEVLNPMLKKSENIFAECLFYQIAACGGQKQASCKMAEEKAKTFIQSLGLPAELCQVADGSGLSPYNYTTPEILVSLLNYVQQQPAIRAHLLPALPVSGTDGTLEKRMTDTPAQGRVLAKTGTLTGISSLAGYLTAGNGHVMSFCIINQGVAKASFGRSFQDQICNILCAP